MLEPTDLGWSEDYETWTSLSDMTEIVIPGDPTPASTDSIMSDGEVEGVVPGLKTAGEKTKARGGKWKWVAASVLLVAGSFGAYQFVFGKGDLSSLCTVLVEVVLPPKVIKEVALPHVQKYRNAAAEAAKGKRQLMQLMSASIYGVIFILPVTFRDWRSQRMLGSQSSLKNLL